MIEVVYSPNWFYGKDIIIDIISIIVLLMIGFFSIKSYRMVKNRNYFYLSLSFFTLALAFIFKILMNFTIYYQAVETRRVGFVTFTYQALKSTDTLFFTGFLLYRILTLLGFYALYCIYVKQPKPAIFIIIYLIIISTYFSQSAYYIFHLTSFIMLCMVTYQFYRNFKKNRLTTSKFLALSFLIITLSHILFTLVRMNLICYVIAEIIQLVAYTLLLITFIMVLKHGKKKKQA